MSDNPHENDEKNIQNEGVSESDNEKFNNDSPEGKNEELADPIPDTKSFEGGTHSNTGVAQAMAQNADEEPPSERPIERVVSGEEYSVLTVTQKRLVVLTVSLAALFSPMATAIYCKAFFDHFLVAMLMSVSRSITYHDCERSSCFRL
jgi:hypothetical protein